MYTDKNNQVNPINCGKLPYAEKMECVTTKTAYDTVTGLYSDKIDNLRIFTILSSDQSYEITERSLNQMAKIYNESIEVICTFSIPPMGNAKNVNIKVSFIVNLWDKNKPMELNEVVKFVKNKISKKIKKYESKLF